MFEEEDEYDWLSNYWEEPAESRTDEIDERLLHVEGYIDPRTYDSYDDSYSQIEEDNQKMDFLAWDKNEDSLIPPTVGNIDIKKLSELPFNGKPRIKDRYHTRPYRNPSKLQTAGKLVKGYVDRPISELQKKVFPLIKNILPFKDWLRWYIPDVSQIHGRYAGFYYIDSDNIIRSNHEIVRKPWKSRKKKLTYGEKQEHLLEKKRARNKRKKDKRTRGITELSIINNPVLHQYWISLHNREKQILQYKENIAKYTTMAEENRKRGRKDYGTWYFWEVKTNTKNWKENQPELKKIRIQLEQIEKGDMTPYFKSKSYLYSLGKECPHFENTQL